MTAAERQAKSRAKEKQQKDTSTRERLIAELMRIYDRQQSMVVARKITKKDPNAEARADDLRAIDKRMREVYEGSLKHLPLEELQIALEVYRQTPDNKGRLHSERSGEDKQFKGQAETEKILAAKGQQPWYANTARLALAGDGLSIAQIDDEHASDLSKQMAGGNKVRPEGAGTADDRSPKEMQNEETEAIIAPKCNIEHGLSEQLLDSTIRSLLPHFGITQDEENGEQASCPLCAKKFYSEVGMTGHLEEEYRAGKRIMDKRREFNSGLNELNATIPEYLRMTPIRSKKDPAVYHYEVIKRLGRYVGQELRKRGRYKLWKEYTNMATYVPPDVLAATKAKVMKQMVTEITWHAGNFVTEAYLVDD